MTGRPRGAQCDGQRRLPGIHRHRHDESPWRRGGGNGVQGDAPAPRRNTGRRRPPEVEGNRVEPRVYRGRKRKTSNVVGVVEKQSAEKLLAIFKKYQIKYILIETLLIVKSDKFYAGRYPLYFVRTCERLERQGKVAFVAMTKSKRYILLKVL